MIDKLNAQQPQLFEPPALEYAITHTGGGHLVQFAPSLRGKQLSARCPQCGEMIAVRLPPQSDAVEVAE